ncbi:MAG: ExeM/NucH family extracellular endonuclease [Anaerolineaceae bacterium]
MQHKSKLINLTLAIVFLFGSFGFLPKTAIAQTAVVLINEVDADQVGTDTAEFIELYDGGVGNTALDGLAIVFYNGSTDVSYQAFDLDTLVTDPSGYFVLCGNAANVSGCDLDVTPDTDLIQNGQDAVALYRANATDFPNGTAVTTTNLVDALVYDTNDADDPGLLILLNLDQPQVNEAGGGDATIVSNQRCPNGSGGLRNTITYTQSEPTSGTENCPPDAPKINEFSASTAGTDVEYIEIIGTPNVDYSAYAVLSVEGDYNSTNSSEGFVDYIMSIGTTDANGLYLGSLAANALENGSMSLLLVKDNTSAVGNDIDIDDNGVIDTTYWSSIVDEVAINDGGSGDLTYGTPVLGVSYDGLPYAPGGASRIPDGFDNELASDWMRNDFDLYGLPGYDGTPIVGEAVNTPGAFNQAYLPVELPPTVSSTYPADGSAGASKTDDIVITFSEPVTVTEPWYDITCTSSGTHTAVVTDTDPVFTLNPDADFVALESCTVTIYATAVVDDDLDDATYDRMEADYLFDFSVAAGCGDAYTAIPAIQGNGDVSLLDGQVVTTEGVVVGDYQTNAYVSGTKNGFYIQSFTPDADPLTSEGLFVYSYMKDVVVGEHVRVAGTVDEYIPSGYTRPLTELTSVTQILTCATGVSVTPTQFDLPADNLLDFESHEGMLVTIPQSLVISEYYNFGRYGQIKLTTERYMTYTAANEPDVDGFAADNANYLLNSITLDDGRTNQNPDPAYHPNGSVFTMENLFRGGDLVANLTGIFDDSYDLYSIQPLQGSDYTAVNTRTTEPELVEADLKVASFNVLNYFTTLDAGSGYWICGPSGTMECRGADTAEELVRQRAKILAALSDIEADVFGLMEIENDKPLGEGEIPDYAVADLVNGLNDIFGTGTYDYIHTGAIGTDAIKVAILYKPTVVTPVGSYQLLTSAVDPRFIDTLNRPTLAQVFADNLTGETFTVAVNHLKSKGSACDGDPDLLDGAGNCNLTRKEAANALVDWLANPTYFPSVENSLIIGDLNSYDKEDPIDMVKLGADDLAGTDDDYLDMMFEVRSEGAYGYVFNGQMGYLDYALANTALMDNVVDVNFWHINADEPSLIDYDMTFKQDPQDALYAPDAYRSSDHDPVVISLRFTPIAVDDAYETPEDTTLIVNGEAGVLANDHLNAADPLIVTLVSGVTNGNLDFSTVDGSFNYTPNANFQGVDEFTYQVSNMVESDVAIVTINVNSVNDAPMAVADTYQTLEDIALTVSVDLGVLANDSDVDGDPLAAVLVTDVTNGVLTLNTDGSFSYTPNVNFNGVDGFTYEAYDGSSYSEVAPVVINVTQVNDAPMAIDDTYNTPEDTILTVAAEQGVLANDYDIEGSPLTITLVSDVANGTLTLNADGSFSYTPDENFYGGDGFTYKVYDGELYSNVAIVTITIGSVNDWPVANDDEYETTSEVPLVKDALEGLLANDALLDPEETVSLVVLAGPTYGTLELNTTDGSFTYIPHPGFYGVDTFEYQLNSTIGLMGEYSDTALVTITVNPQGIIYLPVIVR